MENIIETARLILRPMLAADAEQVFGYRSDAVANQYQGWIPQTPDDVHVFINQRISPEFDKPGTWFQFVITLKTGGMLIGDIGVHFPDTGGLQAELGYTLDIKFQGRGFATEALQALINRLFRQNGKEQVIACIHPRNTASIRLAERLGLRRDDRLQQSLPANEKWPGDLVFAVTRDQWLHEQ